MHQHLPVLEQRYLLHPPSQNVLSDRREFLELTCKNRKLATERYASTARAKDIGLPVSLLSSVAISSYLASRASAILSNQSALSAWLRLPHAG